MESPGHHHSAVVRAIPNVLSSLRLALAAIFAIVAPPLRPFAVLGAGASDWLDGFIARRLHASSWMGGVLDAVADKAFVLAVLATFVHEGTFELWQAGLLLLRDVSVLMVAVYVIATKQWTAFTKMPSRPLGRVTTAALFALFLGMTALPALALFHGILLAAATLASGLAAFDYARAFARARSAARSKP